MSWTALSDADPELAAAGRRLLERDGRAPIAFIATVSARGLPRLSPVGPIFSAGEIYLSIGAHTPKARDLANNGRYALHAVLGRRDEEFQMSGVAAPVTDKAERRAVHAAILFPVFNPDDPVFRLGVEWCAWSRWDGPSERPSFRRYWRASAPKVL